MERGPEDWLLSLRKVDYSEARAAILEFAGVGPKVADCICLMALDKAGVVPIDTHVWQIACRDYGFRAGNSNRKATLIKPSTKKKIAAQQPSLTPKLYAEVIEFFSGIWGEYSGWAHSVLFTADLKHFQDRTKVESPMDRPFDDDDSNVGIHSTYLDPGEVIVKTEEKLQKCDRVSFETTTGHHAMYIATKTEIASEDVMPDVVVVETEKLSKKRNRRTIETTDLPDIKTETKNEVREHNYTKRRSMRIALLAPFT